MKNRIDNLKQKVVIISKIGGNNGARWDCRGIIRNKSSS